MQIGNVNPSLIRLFNYIIINSYSKDEYDEETDDYGGDYDDEDSPSENAKDDNNSEIHDLPVLVFEGLPQPRSSESEEDLIETILSKTVQIPSSSVRRAVRLPIKNNGRALVMVEMDTIENEMKVLKKKETLTKDANLDSELGIRAAKYKELWKMVEQLSIAKQFTNSDPPEYEDSTTATDEENNATILE